MQVSCNKKQVLWWGKSLMCLKIWAPRRRRRRPSFRSRPQASGCHGPMPLRGGSGQHRALSRPPVRPGAKTTIRFSRDSKLLHLIFPSPVGEGSGVRLQRSRSNCDALRSRVSTLASIVRQRVRWTVGCAGAQCRRPHGPKGHRGSAAPRPWPSPEGDRPPLKGVTPRLLIFESYNFLFFQTYNS
jgi:hypothetical protein